MDAIKDLLGSISGYKQKYENVSEELVLVSEQIDLLYKQLDDANELVEKLKLLTTKPPPPTIDYEVERSAAWVQQQLESMELNIVWLPHDANYKLTNRKNFLNIVAWDTTDRLEYFRNFFDCDKFAMLFKVTVNLVFHLTQVAYVVDYKSGHAYNLILYPSSEIMVFEPQSDGMYVWTKRLTNFYSLHGAYVLI